MARASGESLSSREPSGSARGERAQTSEGWTAFTCRARDGLELFARDYGSRLLDTTPVLCLPGLTRNSRDFHELAVALSQDGKAPRRVVAMDFRGRGRSAWDRNWKNYAVPVELADVLDLMVAAGLEHAAIVGTSRGGLVAMAMGAVRPAVIAGVVLNDIGPELAAKGLARIKSYVGKVPAQPDWRAAARFLKTMNEASFPAATEADWMRLARKQLVERKGQIVPDYDPALARTLEAIDLSQPQPTAWPQFKSLGGVPMMVIRGENSDLLTAETVAAMKQRRKGMETLTVADSGHAPFLDDTPTINAIATFIRRLDKG